MKPGEEASWRDAAVSLKKNHLLFTFSTFLKERKVMSLPLDDGSGMVTFTLQRAATQMHWLFMRLY